MHQHCNEKGRKNASCDCNGQCVAVAARRRTAPWPCRSCGAEIPPTALDCPGCGSPWNYRHRRTIEDEIRECESEKPPVHGGGRFGMAYAEIIENPGIPITARLIYALIACHASGRTGVARITIERIAEGLGLDESNVRRNIKVLEQALIIRRISKKRQPFVCQIRVPAHEQADAIKAPAPVERAPVPDIQNQNTKPKILTMEKARQTRPPVSDGGDG